jgi:hypothetical protein
VETEDTHTPPDPHMQALGNAQVHGKDLRQWRLHQPSAASVHPRRNTEPNARNIVGDAQARGRQVQQAIITDTNSPPQFARAGSNIATAAMLLRNLLKPADPQ